MGGGVGDQITCFKIISNLLQKLNSIFSKNIDIKIYNHYK
jgi:hypothetical protein